MIPVNSSLTQLIFAIHGVGNPRPGVVKTAIEKNLDDVGLKIPVHEFNWNVHLPYQVDPNRFSNKGITWDRVKFLAVRLADACLIDLPQVPFKSTHWSWKVHYITFQVSECFLALLIAINIIFLPGLYLIGPIDDLKFREDWFLVLLHIMNWINNLLFTSIGLSVFYASITAIIRKSLLPLWITIRRLILLILRPCILVAALIFSQLIMSIFNKIVYWGTLILIGWGFIILINQSNSSGNIPKALITPIWWFLILLSLAFIIYTFTHFFIDPADKILLDIFLYISDKEHRHNLQKFLDKELTSILAKDNEIILTCHSLGTVLAIDSLLHSKIWTGKEIVTLITYGSPLKRFFTRFFPGHIFPFPIDECARCAAARIAHFRWLNGYRPYDEVGTLIGLSKFKWTKEFSTDQPRKWFNHSGYWSDPQVRDKTIIHLSELSFSEKLKRSEVPLEQTTAPFLSDNHRQLITIITSLSTLTIAIVIAMTSFLASIHYRHDIIDANYYDAQKLFNTGIETKAKVFYNEQIEYTQQRYNSYQPQTARPELTFYNRIFEVEYVAGGKLQHYKNVLNTTSYYNMAKSDQWVNWVNLAQFITRDKKPELSAFLMEPSTGATKYRYTLSAKSDDINLIYDPQRSDRFVLPDFKPKPSTSALYIALIEGAIFSLLITIPYGILTWCVCLVIILLLIGDTKLLKSFFLLSWSHKKF